ncbi:MAG: hypothetical protein IGR93_17950 [Hydrococcus sp. C42_A2020_068]|nr:hypothetical protein [Pleurocapsa sp. PCC 7327]MBF2021916.1 hypothetical protein [Hydrococcus sp. C42_A2020_068]
MRSYLRIANPTKQFGKTTKNSEYQPNKNPTIDKYSRVQPLAQSNR